MHVRVTSLMKSLREPDMPLSPVLHLFIDGGLAASADFLFLKFPLTLFCSAAGFSPHIQIAFPSCLERVESTCSHVENADRLLTVLQGFL